MASDAFGAGPWSASLVTSPARIDAEASDTATWDQREHRVGQRARGRGAATARGANSKPRADARAGRRQRRSGTCRDPDASGVAPPLLGWRLSARPSTPPGASKACFVVALRRVGRDREPWCGIASPAGTWECADGRPTLRSRLERSGETPGSHLAIEPLSPRQPVNHGFADHPCRSRARDVVMDATATKKLTGPNVPARPADFVVQGWAARSLLGGHDELIGRRVHVECVRTRRVVAVRDGRVAGGTRKRPAPARGKLCGPRS